MIVYKPTTSCDNRSVIDELVEDVLIGGFALPGAEPKQYYNIDYFIPFHSN